MFILWIIPFIIRFDPVPNVVLGLHLLFYPTLYQLGYVESYFLVVAALKVTKILKLKGFCKRIQSIFCW